MKNEQLKKAGINSLMINAFKNSLKICPDGWETLYVWNYTNKYTRTQTTSCNINKYLCEVHKNLNKHIKGRKLIINVAYSIWHSFLYKKFLLKSLPIICLQVLLQWDWFISDYLWNWLIITNISLFIGLTPRFLAKYHVFGVCLSLLLLVRAVDKGYVFVNAFVRFWFGRCVLWSVRNICDACLVNQTDLFNSQKY